MDFLLSSLRVRVWGRCDALRDFLADLWMGGIGLGVVFLGERMYLCVGASLLEKSSLQQLTTSLLKYYSIWVIIIMKSRLISNS